MTAISKRYRYRIHEAGTTAPTDLTVEWEFTTASATHPIAEDGVGQIGGQRIEPKSSRASSRPWSVELVDKDGVVTAILADGDGRAQLLRRLADMAVSTDDGASYTMLATARIDDVELSGVSGYRLTHQDERLIERTTTIFRGSNTTRIAPAGVNAAWLDFQPPAARSFAVASVDAVNNRTEYQVTSALEDLPEGVTVNEDPTFVPQSALELWEDDVVANPAGNAGNFTHLRVNLDGTDREVIAFNGATGGNPLRKLRGDGPARITRFMVAGYQDPGVVGEQIRSAHFHMPTHDPTEELHLHIGGQDGIDPFTFIKNIYDGSYQDAANPQTVRYESAAFTAYHPTTNPNGLVDNPRFLKIHPDIDGPMIMAEAVDEVYAWAGVTPFINAAGEIAPRLSRLPATDQVADPDTLFEFTAAKLTEPHPSWHNVGREQVTVVETIFSYTRAAQVTDSDSARGGRIDGLVNATAKVVREHDNVSTAGRAVHVVKVRGIHRYGDRSFFAGQISAEMFERFGDGAIRTTGSGTSTAESVKPGDWVVQDLASYPALQNQSRSGKRLMQVMSRVDTPAGPEFELLEAGPNSQPLGALTVTLAANSNDDHTAIDATIGTLPSGADGYELHVAVNGSEPAEGSPLWQYRTIRGTQAETVTIRRVPSGSTIWVRPRATGIGRISGDWGTADSQATTALTAPSGAAASGVAGDVATVSWTNGEADFDLVLDLETLGLRRLTSGKLARHVANDGTDPFATGDWTAVGLSGAGVYLNSGNLRWEFGDDADRHGVIYTAIASRAKAMIQGEIAVQHATGVVELAAHLVDADNMVRAGYTVHASATTLFLVEENAGSVVATTTQAGGVRAAATAYRVALYVDRDQAAESYDFTEPASLSRANADGLTATAGQLGASANSGGTAGLQYGELRSWYAHADKVVVCSGLVSGSGQKFKLLDSGDSVLASATESSGVATVDCIAVRMDLVVKVVITDSSDVELEDLTPSGGVWGGDTYFAGTAVARADRVRLANGTTSYKIRGLALSEPYTAGVRHIDGYGGESSRATTDFETTGTAETVPKPEGIRVLVGA